MPFVTFDFECNRCGKQYPDKMVLRKDMDAQRCDDCKGQLRRLPAATRTTFRFADRKLKK